MDSLVEVAGLAKSYAGRRVVDDFDLTVLPGEVVGILGANGAGKTTAVECIQGLRPCDHGTIRLCGLDPIRDRVSLAGRIGSQLQDSAMPDRLRVEEALRFFAGSRADPIDAVLDRWGLVDHRRTAFAALSGGQQQRLFIALALLNKPDVVFLDELTQGLDPHARRGVWAFIDELRGAGTTILLVTHFMDEAEALCDRIIVMRDGRTVAAGAPGELLARYGGDARIRFTPPDGLDTHALSRLPGWTGVTSIDGIVTVSGNHETIAHTCAALAATGSVPADLDIRQATLEDALLPLIGPDGAS